MGRKAKSLDDLPNELIHRILQYSDSGSVIACTLVCRSLHDVIRQSTELQYLFELGMDGMVNCAGPTIPYQDRLKELIGHRKAWANLRWRQSSLRIPGEIEELNLYGFVAGVFAKLIHRQTFVTRHLSTINAHESNDRWIDRELSFPAKEFVMDPTQDLVIFLEEDTRPWSYNGQRSICLHVQTLSTGDPHPLARNAALTFDIPPHPDESGRNNIWFSRIKLAMDVVLMQYSVGNDWEGHEGMHFQFWNWKSGHDWLIDGYIEFTECSFISPRAVVFASVGETSPSLNICTFEYDEETAETTTTHKANLHLPEPVSDCDFDSTAMQTPPILDPAHFPPSKIAATAPESHINIVSYRLTTGDDEEHEFDLFIPNSILLDYASNTPVGQVPWEDWGPENTHLEGHPLGTPAFSSYGSRVVSSSLEPDSIDIIDLNPRRREGPSLSTAEPGLARRTYSTHSTAPPGLFQGDGAYTCLPIWRTTRQLNSSYSAFFIDDERIVGLKEEPEESFDDSDCEDADILAF
ncbi:hypothetical protein EYR40_002618 [Pleurotus pulmonarius]|nr:hypothetical protein EYR40_002618 [Pleurotus pulmonarius]